MIANDPGSKRNPNQTLRTDATETVELSAAPLRMLYDAGSLRYIKFRGVEVLRGIAFFVRDANWGTVPSSIEDLKIEHSPTGFTLHFRAKSKVDDIDFGWNCAISGTDDQISFEILGTAFSNFESNRTGFVVLHPNTLAGHPLEVTHPDGSQSKGSFPVLISPHQPFKDISRMDWQLDGLELQLTFAGEVFETEDQRNWLDASYKTYCTPLERPFPVSVKIGDRVQQKITLSFLGNVAEAPDQPAENQLVVKDNHQRMPEVGLTANEAHLTQPAVDHLRQLKLSHLRVEAKTHEENWTEGFERQLRQSVQLAVPLELVIYTQADRIASHIAAITSSARFNNLDLKRVVAFDLDEKSTSSDFIASVSAPIRKHFGGVPFGGGTDYYFTEVNRFRPPMERVDFLTFSINPQVHASDNLSILETISTFSDIARSAHQISTGKPVYLSPVTLKARLNPAATKPEARFKSKAERTDARQAERLAKLWTLGSLKSISQTELSGATFFQTYGPEGILSEERVYPVYDVFSLISRMKGFNVVEAVSSDPLVFEGIVFEKDEERYYVLMNFTEEPQSVTVSKHTQSLGAKEIVALDKTMEKVDLI